jgi:hypothetical protein
MKKVLVLLCCGLLLFGTAGVAFAADHSVDVTVNAITDVIITPVGSTDVAITIPSLETWTTADETTGLSWETNQSSRYITVNTDLSGVDYTLDLRVTSTIDTGSASGATNVAISTTPANVVTGITTEQGTCTLGYQAYAEVTDTPVTEEHTITYTITGS